MSACRNRRKPIGAGRKAMCGREAAIYYRLIYCGARMCSDVGLIYTRSCYGMFRYLSLKVYALKDLVNRLRLPVCGGSSCGVHQDALRVKNKSIFACVLEAQPVLVVYGHINQECPGVALWINPARVSEPVPVRERPTRGKWVAVDGCGRPFLPLLSPHHFHPFDVSDPMAGGQGRAWITTKDYHISYALHGKSLNGCLDLYLTIFG